MKRKIVKYGLVTATLACIAMSIECQTTFRLWSHAKKLYYQVAATHANMACKLLYIYYTRVNTNTVSPELNTPDNWVPTGTNTVTLDGTNWITVFVWDMTNDAGMFMVKH